MSVQNSQRKLVRKEDFYMANLIAILAKQFYDEHYPDVPVMAIGEQLLESYQDDLDSMPEDVQKEFFNENWHLAEMDFQKL